MPAVRTSSYIPARSFSVLPLPGSPRRHCVRPTNRASFLPRCPQRLDAGAASQPTIGVHRRAPYQHRSPIRGDDEVRALAAAVELYSNRLLGHQRAVGHLAGRGFEREQLIRERIGFAVGDELMRYLGGATCPCGPPGVLACSAPPACLATSGYPAPSRCWVGIRPASIDALSLSSRVRSICWPCSNGIPGLAHPGLRGVKDPADLATFAEGRAVLRHAISQAVACG
jgi:hypothetical protein